MSTQRAMRRLKPDPVPDSAVRQILSMALYAPSGGNRQSWSFVVVRDPAKRARLGELYREAWHELVKLPYYAAAAKEPPDSPAGKLLASATHLSEHLGEAPVLILACIALDQGVSPTLTTGASIYPAVQNLMIDLALHARGSRFERATRWLVRPFESLFRRFPAVRRHGYLIAWAVEKPRAGGLAPGRRPDPRWASLRDIVGVAQMSMGWLVTAVLPERLIPAVGRGLGEVAAAFARRATRRGAEEMRRRLGPQLDEGESRALFVEHVKRKYEHLLGRARDTHRRGWHPEVELCGAEHLRRALAAGRGAVLWVTACCGPLVPKIALERGGFRITHLSMPLHGGFSHSRLALRVLNPWTRRSEDKHLAGRVVMRLDGTIAHLMRLREILLANGCVSIAGEHRGRRNVTVPVLGEEQAFASGACSLARSTGAALLMVQSHRVAPGAYRVVIEPVATDQGLSPLAREKAVIGDLAARLDAWVRAHPADWERWSTIDPAID